MEAICHESRLVLMDKTTANRAPPGLGDHLPSPTRMDSVISAGQVSALVADGFTLTVIAERVVPLSEGQSDDPIGL